MDNTIKPDELVNDIKKRITQEYAPLVPEAYRERVQLVCYILELNDQFAWLDQPAQYQVTRECARIMYEFMSQFCTVGVGEINKVIGKANVQNQAKVWTRFRAATRDKPHMKGVVGGILLDGRRNSRHLCNDVRRHQSNRSWGTPPQTV
ncbi:hypothetical protein FHETE_3159 [Fusarium heterosporum]|uniref:Uncharacterized protein n=1 Tax=Fusarium heterosporum TaxID=42747 RepID=A0A8H5WSF7_FUSHE|nr:hypothetical protein FHETE_3159 [Fusarium heterosporum]